MWPGYSSENGPNSYQCDEFPFASTYERPKVRMLESNAYALCPIPTSHNRDAGGALETHFYQKDRILVGDTFSNTFGPINGDSPPPSREELCGEPVN